jgi:chlorophyll(ide) b reductase
MDISNIGLHNISPGMVTTDLLMSGADTSQSKFFINCMAEPPEVVADFLVPRIREAARKRSTGSSIKFLTPIKAYSNLFARLIAGKRKNRYVPEDD